MRRINVGAKEMLGNFPIFLFLLQCTAGLGVWSVVPSNPKSCVKIPVDVYFIIAHTLLHGLREKLSSQTSKERVPYLILLNCFLDADFSRKCGKAGGKTNNRKTRKC